MPYDVNQFAGYERDDEVTLVRTLVYARRKKSFLRWLSIVNGDAPVPNLFYKWCDLLSIERQILEHPRGTIFVSFHTQSYFLLILVLSDLKIPCHVIVAESLLEKFESINFEGKQYITLHTGLPPSVIKDCLAKRAAIFIMADVAAIGGRDSYFPVLDKAMIYNTTWCELATKFDLNIVLSLVKDKIDHTEILLKPISANERTHFALGCHIFDEFREFLGGDNEMWENLPAYDKLAVNLPSFFDAPYQDIFDGLIRSARCDSVISGTIMKALRNTDLAPPMR